MLIYCCCWWWSCWLQMFHTDAPPLPWDSDKEYSRDRVELYYLSNAGQQLPQVRASKCQCCAAPVCIVLRFAFANGSTGQQLSCGVM
jgi:hypothetical protein